MRTGYVAILGRPNVGKSTLLNSLVGEKLAAVSPKAQTTRRRMMGILTNEDSQLIFIDTPGMHRAPVGKKLNEYCVSEAVDSLKDADALVYVIDGSRPFRPGKEDGDERFILETLKKIHAKKPRPLYVFLNKMDLWQKEGARFAPQEDLVEGLKDLTIKSMFAISAKTGKGLEDALAALRAEMPEGPFLYPEEELTNQSVRQIAGELVQESLFYLLGDELPYSCAVEVERFLEPSEKQRYPEIHASIHVERDSQKPMVIGKGGSKIKSIGENARKAIEKLMGGKVVLKLFVKVTPGWTKNAQELKRLGYIVPEST